MIAIACINHRATAGLLETLAFGRKLCQTYLFFIHKYLS